MGASTSAVGTTKGSRSTSQSQITKQSAKKKSRTRSTSEAVQTPRPTDADSSRQPTRGLWSDFMAASRAVLAGKAIPKTIRKRLGTTDCPLRYMKYQTIWHAKSAAERLTAQGIPVEVIKCGLCRTWHLMRTAQLHRRTVR